MSATFATLFERSRYSGRRWWGLDEDDSAREQGMKQQERFAVSMIGLALEHDPKFLAHLLERVCGLKGLSGAHGWEVFVEPQNWGDLVLKHRASSSFVVVEFKIEANLEEHQNPSTKRFFLPTRTGECAGYGREIAQIASRENWRQLRYVTVEKRASWSKVSREDHNLECVHSEWKQFLREDVKEESKLEADVYDCLARFGVAIFFARRMKEMKIAAQATQPLAILIRVLAKFGVNFRPKLLNNVNTEALGFEIHSKDFPKFAKNIEAEEHPAGWFGYESDAPFGPRLSIWFSCYDTNTGQIKPAARERIKKALQAVPIKERQFRDDGASLNVFCKAEDSPGDLEWFTKVLTAIDE